LLLKFAVVKMSELTVYYYTLRYICSELKSTRVIRTWNIVCVDVNIYYIVCVDVNIYYIVCVDVNIYYIVCLNIIEFEVQSV